MLNCKNPLLKIDSRNFIKKHPEFIGKSFVKYTTLKTKPWLNEYIRNGMITPLPCGSCLTCINNKRYRWVKRCMVEQKNWDFTYFITLTYADENLPFNSKTGEIELSVKDFQKFIKYFRKLTSPYKCKYLCAGEYGSQTKRPHYHVIIFTNYKLDLKFMKYSKVEGLESSHPLFMCDLIDKAWKHKGWCWVAHDFDGESFAYVVSYSNKSSTKKQLNKNLKYRDYLREQMMLTGDLSLKKKIEQIDVSFKPEFLVMSKKPPIGVDFKDKDKLDWSDIPSNVLKWKSNEINPFTTKELWNIYEQILSDRRKVFYDELERKDIHADVEYSRQKYKDKERHYKNLKHIN